MKKGVDIVNRISKLDALGWLNGFEGGWLANGFLINEIFGYLLSPISSINRFNRSSRFALLAISHPHTTMTFQPTLFNSSTFRLSRSIFAEIFSVQNSVFVAGNLDLLQPG